MSEAGDPPRGYAILLAYHYPPMIGAASEREAAFARHLPRTGWEPIVVTSAKGLFHRDTRLPLPQARVYRTASFEPGRLMRAVVRPGDVDDVQTVQPVGGHGVADLLRRTIRQWVYIPDGQIGWIPFAIRSLRQALESVSAPVVVLSSSVPVSAHLAARRVSRSIGVPWIAEFRDIWATAGPGLRPRSELRRRIDRRIERGIVQRANRVVVTTERAAEELTKVYPGLPSERFAVVRNGFEPLDVRHDAPLRTERFRLVFVASTLYMPVEPLLAAMSRLAHDRPNKFIFQVLGPSEPWREAASKLNVGEWLRLEGVVPASAARAAVQRASANLLCLPGDEYAGFVSAKFYEYLAARRPILAVLPPGSEMETLGRRFGELRVVHGYGTAELHGALDRLLDDHQAGRLENSVTPREDLEELSWETQAGRLAELFDSLAAARTATAPRRR